MQVKNKSHIQEQTEGGLNDHMFSTAAWGHAHPPPAELHLSDKWRLKNMIKALIIMSNISWNGIFYIFNKTYKKKRCQTSALLKQVW